MSSDPLPPPSGPVPIPYPNIAVGRPLTKESWPAEFQFTLTRLAWRFGAGLRVNVTNSEWVEISVENLSAIQLEAQLQLERKSFFGSAEPRVQVIKPLRPSGEEIHLHMLSAPQWGDLATMASKGKK